MSNVVLTIPANAASGTVTFPFTAADDMTVEGGGESLNIRSTLLIVAGTDPDTSLAVANATLTINDPVAADTAPAFAADAAVSAQTFTVGTAVDLTLPMATGGEDGIVYTLSTALPAGLTFNSGTRVLDGTPTAVATAATYFYRAADGDGNNMPSDSVLLTFTITVSADTAPAFAGNAAIEAQTYAALTAIMPLTLPTATGGNGDITYTLTPAIPGLTLDAATGVLTGMPTTEATATTYTYTAADGDDNTAAGDEVSLTFSLTVTEAIPTGVVMSVNPTMVMESATPTAVMLTATVTGGTFNVARVVRWRINDGTASQFTDYTRIGNTDLTIPANMVSGTATFMFTAHVDSVAEPAGETVRIEGGVLTIAQTGTDSSLSFTPAILTINDGTDTGTAPTSQTVTINPTAVTESADPTDITATVTLNGGVFSVARAFRIEARGGTASAVEVDYMSIDNTILTIPANTASASVIFEFTAVVDTDADSGETVMIRSTLLDISENAPDPTVPFMSATLTINDAPAPGTDTTPAFSTTVSAQVYSVGTAVNLTLPAATDGNGVITYTLAPTALAAGLTFNPAANPPTITGTPNTQASATTYTYTATDEDGDDASLAFAISVGAAPVDATPAFANGARIPTQDFTVDVRIASLSLPQATGGDAPLTYTLTPALSAGLTFDGTARTITGTPTTAATLVTYRYTVTDMDGDTATLTFRVTVVASTGLTFGGATVSDQAYIVSQLITPLTLPVATRGDGAITYTLTPALPTGLTYNATARTITGTPTAVAGAMDYTYTATDTANDTATLMFSIIVNTEQVQDMARNEIILPEATRALVNSTAVSITRRIGQAVGSIPAPTVGSFNLAGQQMGGQDNLANALRTHGEAMTTDSRDIKEMLADSNFVLPLNGGAGIDASTTAFWGSGEYRDFSGESGEFEWEGSLSGFQLGVDARLHNDLLVGVAVSLLESDIEYEDDGATGLLGNGDYELDMTSAHPYIGWRAVGADWWATVGLGSGDLKSTAKHERNANAENRRSQPANHRRRR